MSSGQYRTPVAPAVFIFVCAACGCAGWLLSALGRLGAPAYAVLVVSGVIGFLIWQRRYHPRLKFFPNPQKLKRRFGRGLPLAFLALAVLALLGGVLHAPNNYDGLAYRTPRVLHWLAEGRWFWIPTEFPRLNSRGSGWEWVTAPILALTRTDRSLWLISAASFLLVPGRVFSILGLLGVRNRVAWAWTWLLPTGYCYLLQAGGIANDLFGGVVAMCAIEYALRARASGRSGELWISVLAAGLMTASKAFNLVLLLPWAIAVLPSWRLALRKPLVAALVAIMAAGCSMIPTAILNIQYCGDWTGLKAEPQAIGGNPVFRFFINILLMLMQDFVPPVFPLSDKWNHLMERVISPGFSAMLHRNFEPFAAGLKLDDMQREEGAGLGFGLSVLLVIVIMVRLLHASRPAWCGWLKSLWRYETLVVIGAWISTAVLFCQMGMSGSGRYLAPFHATLIVTFLIGGDGIVKIVRQRWFAWAGILVCLIAALPLVLSPSRPLWPALTLLRYFGGDQSNNRIVRKAWMVYSVTSQRSDAFAPARAILPPNLKVLGVFTSDDPETSLWRPFGSLRTLHIQRNERADHMKKRGIEYALVKTSMIPDYCKMSFDDWTRTNNAEVVNKVTFLLKASVESSEWVLVKLR